MDKALERRLLLSELQSYQQLLNERGISPPLTFDEAEKLEDSDLRRLVRESRDLARTPHAG